MPQIAPRGRQRTGLEATAPHSPLFQLAVSDRHPRCLLHLAGTSRSLRWRFAVSETLAGLGALILDEGQDMECWQSCGSTDVMF